MSSTYNAITNLQEIEMDSLIVNLATIDTALVDNLDCNVGVIDTLSSTTATLTSANIPTLTNTTLTNTTSNTTNLNTNNIQPSPVSSAVSLYTTGTGLLTLGNLSNTNLITINQSTLLQSNKNLTLAGTGKIITPKLRVSDLSADKIVLTDANDDLVSSSWGQSDLVILSANNTFTGNNTFSTFNTFNGNVLANTLRGTTAGSAISLYSTTTGGITIGGSSSGINLSDNTTLATGKNITITPTGHLVAETIRGYAFANPVSLYLAQTGAISFGNNLGTGGGITINDNTTLASGKTITLNATGGEILSPKYNSTSATQALTIGGTNTTSEIRVGGALTTGTLQLGTLGTMTGLIQCNSDLSVGSGATGKGIACSYFTALQATDLVRFLQNTTTGNVRICENHTSGGITIGHLTPASDLGTLTINKNTTMASSKILSTTYINPLSVSGDFYLGYTSTGGTFTIGHNTPASDGGSLIINRSTTYNKNISMLNNNIQFTSGGQLHINIIRGVSFADGVSLYLSQTGPISFGNNLGTGVGITLNDNTTLATNRNLILQGTGKITTPNILVSGLTASKMVLTDGSKNLISSSYTDTDFARLTADNTFSGTTNTFSNTIVCNTISGALLGSITLYGGGIGTTISLGSLLGGGLTIFENTTLGINKNLTLQGTGKITTPNILVSGLTASKMVLTDSSKNLISSIYTDTDFVLKGGSSMTGTLNVNDIQGTTTSSAITLFTNSSVSSPSITLGNVSGGTLTINPNASFSGTITGNTISATATNSTATLFGNITNGSVSIAGSLTDGNLLVGFGMRNFGIRLGSTSYNSATDTGYIDLLLPVRVQYDITMATTNKILCNSYQGRTTNSNVSLFTETSGATNTITIGNTSASNTTINTPVVLASGKNLTLSTTGKIVVDTIEGVGATEAIALFSTTTTAGITLGSSNTSCVITIGNSTASSDTGRIQLNKNLTLGTTGGLNPKNINCNYYYGLSTSSDVVIGGSTTSGAITLGDSSQVTPFTGGTFNYSFFAVGRYLGIINRRWAYTNVGYGDATTPTLFKTSILSGKYLTSTLYSGAPTAEWCSFESDTAGEGSAFLQNGDTQILVNAGDAGGFPLFWFDEDTLQSSPAGSTSYAWTGWKISTGGAFTTASSRKIKRDIQPIIKDGLLDKLENIEFVNYKMKPPKEELLYKNGVLREKYRRVHMGCIAEDVKQIFPECVERENDDAIWMLNYTDLNLYFNKGVQELIKQNKAQQIEINNNKTLIDTQQTIIDDLTARLVRLEQIILNP